MKEVSGEKMCEIAMRARKITWRELAPAYIVAAIMVEAEATPEEVVNYIEDKFFNV